MKYKEFIHVNENFIPVFDLENEESDQYWSLFIPNDIFRDVLSSVIDSLNINNNANPVWLQGTYGTGKTHATSVIKHLLSDESLPEYNLEDKQLTSKLNNFRENNKVFPVIIKGTSTIGDSRRFKNTIQSAVKKALKEKNMRVSVPSDFEVMTNILEEYPLKKKDIKGTKLEAFSPDEISYRLKNKDSEILIEVEDIFMKKNLAPYSQDNIVDWLIEVRDKLKEDYGIDYLMIFWDEFTGALNMLNVEVILSQIQDIAEAKNKGISLFIVSHRTRSTQVNINQEIIDKIMDRFEPKYYSMEPVATYELMERSISKDETWVEVKNKYSDVISPLIDKISVNDGVRNKKALENLYPIHPYTSYLATFVAQEIGSTERSIFKFLHDDIEFGFRHFIDTFKIDQRYFLTADYLWDFFYEDFDKSEDEKISSSIKKYKLYYDDFKKLDEEYIVIFKVILLLNVLYKIATVGKGSLTIPSEENIKNVFIGSVYQDKVDLVLNYIDKKSIINKTPDGLFELTTNNLPLEQVNSEIEKLRKQSKIKNLLSNTDLKNINKHISDKVIREIEIKVYDSDIQENRLISDLERGLFENSGYLHMILFLCKTPEEYVTINKVIKSVSDKDFLNNQIVIISEAILGKENFNKYLEYKALAKVADAHNYKEDMENYNKHANKYIENWVNEIKRKTVSWYLNDETGKLPLSTFINKINEDLSKSIFSNGLENLSETLKNRNIWPKVLAKIQAEKFIAARNIEELKDNLKGVDKQSLCILRDNNGSYIVKNNLELASNIKDNHPIKKIQDFIDKTFEHAQNEGKFNLGIKLKPLTEEPYGLYPNKLNVAAFSFCLRKYVNKLYDEKGNVIDETKMKNKIIAIFEYWTKNKGEHELYVRYGSENEKKLNELINEIFNLGVDSSNQSISTVRWELRMWIKNNNIPLWLLKYSYINMQNNSLDDSIEALFDFLKPNDGNLPDEIIQNCYNKINPLKADLKWSVKDDPEELYKRFLEDFDKNFTSEDIDEIKKHLKQSMPEEVYDWSEDKVKNEIYHWLLDSPMNLKDPKMEVNVDGDVISVSIDDEATGDILVNVAGNGFYSKIKNGKASIVVSGFEAGKSYLASVSYDGDENFQQDKRTVTVKVPKKVLKNPNMEVSVDGGVISVSIDDEATGDILVNVAGNGFYSKIENGKASISVPGLEAGKSYLASVSYDGDENFDKSKLIINMDMPLILKNPNMEVSVDGGVISVSIDDEATGDILIKIDDNSYSTQIINGKSFIRIPNLEVNKKYVASIYYVGDDQFKSVEEQINIFIQNELTMEYSIEKIVEVDADILKNALIQVFKNKEEITPMDIIDYLGRMNNGSS